MTNPRSLRDASDSVVEKLDQKEFTDSAQLFGEIKFNVERLIERNPDSPRVPAIALLAAGVKGKPLETEQVRTVILALATMTPQGTLAESLVAVLKQFGVDITVNDPASRTPTTGSTPTVQQILVYAAGNPIPTTIDPDDSRYKNYLDNLVQNEGYKIEPVTSDGDLVYRQPSRTAIATPHVQSEDEMVPVHGRGWVGKGVKVRDEKISIKDGHAKANLVARHDSTGKVTHFEEK
jgi:hypothetical protein